VDRRIGRFFVDRRLPENNSLWKDRLLYISFGNGFLFIPVYYDILYRIGIPLEILLDEKHIEFMEQIMHFSTLHERNEISFTEELASLRGLLRGRVQDTEYYSALNNYLEQPGQGSLGSFGLPFHSLNRGDVFLYILCDLPLNKAQWELAIRYWYALVPSYLLLDDVRDYEDDMEKGEDNVVIDLGGGVEAFEKTFELFRKNCETLSELNPTLAEFLLTYEEGLKEKIPVKD
jgi:hypothetical protein